MHFMKIKLHDLQPWKLLTVLKSDSVCVYLLKKNYLFEVRFREVMFYSVPSQHRRRVFVLKLIVAAFVLISLESSVFLQVWVNSSTSVKSEHLAAADPDSGPHDLIFNALPPQNGYLALKHRPSLAISNFTQFDIDEGKLLFVHKGAL